MSEFNHYSGCKGDIENCSACALLSAGEEGPNYAGWPLAFMQSGVRIPKKYMKALLKELQSENLAYVENLIRTLVQHGYDIGEIRNG